MVKIRLNREVCVEVTKIAHSIPTEGSFLSDPRHGCRFIEAQQYVFLRGLQERTSLRVESAKQIQHTHDGRKANNRTDFIRIHRSRCS